MTTSALTVLSVAYPFAHVGPDAAGGAEQIVSLLDDALVGAGHRSIVVARAGSRVAGELIAIREEHGELDGAAVGRVHAEVAGALARALATERVDVVHMHGVDFERYLPRRGAPVLVTLHLPPSWYAREALASIGPDTHVCCVSESQHAAMPPWASGATVIPNGVRLDAARPRVRKASYCLVLARLCVEKGAHDALDAATDAGVRLVLAGDLSPWPEHRRYFDEVVAPRLRNGHRWIGPAGSARKWRLLSTARALLVPSRAPETSSLVAMEALASGTPVIAYPSGALPRIVEHGRTGFVVDGVGEMARAIAHAEEIDPRACRRAAEERYSATVMTARYLDLYEQLARSHRPALRPSTSTSIVLQEVRGVAALAELAPAWRSLAGQCPGASPFQTAEWLLPYARRFCREGAGADPWALVARAGDELVGIAPLCTKKVGGKEITTLLGEGVSDYLDVLVRPEHAARCAAAFVEALVGRCERGASVVLDELREGSPLRTCAAPADAVEDESVRGPCPALRLMRGLDPIPRALRDRIRYCTRRAERIGPVTFVDAKAEAAGDWLETLFALHGARWSARGEAGVLARPEVQLFQREAVGALARAGLAAVHGLVIGTQRTAAMLVLRDVWTAYYYIGGFDPRFEAVSPGTLLVAHAIDRARENGLGDFDFLRGGEAYKYRFGARDRWSRRRVLVRRATA